MKVASAVFSTSQQLSDLHHDRPQVAILDLTYGCCTQRYKTASVVYPSPQSGGTNVAMTALLRDETHQSMTKFLQQLKEVMDPAYFFVDKDFGQIDALRETFPNARIFLCVFHVIKYIGNLLATLHCPNAKDLVAIKKNLFQLAKKMVNAYSETAFNIAWEEFQTTGAGCTVRSANGKVTPVNDYMMKNWLGCTEMWSRFHRRNLPIRFTYTTNRVESYFGCLKAEMKVFYGATPSIVEFIPFLISYMSRRHTRIAMQCIKRFSPNDKFKGLCHEASKDLTK